MATPLPLLLVLVLTQAWMSAGQGRSNTLERARETMEIATNEVITELKSEGMDEETLDLIQDKARERELFTSEAGLKEVARLQESLVLYDTAASKMAAPQLLPSHQCSSRALKTVNAVLERLPMGGVARPLTSIAVLQSQGCKDGALQVASALLQLVRAARPTQKASRTARYRSRKCEEVAACRAQGLTQVRDLFSSEPDLLLLYDGVASSVFGAENQGDLARALADDVIENMENEEVKVELRKRRSLAAMATEFRHRRGTCVDQTEQKVQSVISWIPFIGTLYNLTSAAVYAAKGCTDVAKERAIEGATDLATDIASVATAGAGAAVFTGAKVAVKAGTKLATKATFSLVKKSFKKAAKSALKSTVKGYLNPVKGAITEVGDVLKLAKNIGELATKGTKKAAQKIADGVRGLSSKRAKSASRAGGSVGEHIADARRVDSSPGGPNFGEQGVRCQRSPGGKCIDRLQKKMQKQSKDAANAAQASKDRMQDLWKKQKGFQDVASDIKKDFNLDIKDKFSNRLHGTYLDLTDEALTNKDIFKALQQHQVFDGTQKVLYVKQNIGGEKVYYRMYPSGILRPNIKDQFVVEILNTGQRKFVAATYNDMVKKMDGFVDDFARAPGATVADKRKEMAKAMLEAIENGQKRQPDFDSVFNPLGPGGTKAQEARDAAVDWIIITQTAEAAAPGASRKVGQAGPSSTNWQDHLKEKLGRSPGMDEFAQSQLRAMIKNPTLTFRDLQNTYFPTYQGGTQLTRDLILDTDIARKKAKTAADKVDGGRNSAQRLQDDLSDRKRRYAPFLFMH